MNWQEQLAWVNKSHFESGHIGVFIYEDSEIIFNDFWWWMWLYGCIEDILIKECVDTGLLHFWIVGT